LTGLTKRTHSGERQYQISKLNIACLIVVGTESQTIED